MMSREFKIRIIEAIIFFFVIFFGVWGIGFFLTGSIKAFEWSRFGQAIVGIIDFVTLILGVVHVIFDIRNIE